MAHFAGPTELTAWPPQAAAEVLLGREQRRNPLPLVADDVHQAGEHKAEQLRPRNFGGYKYGARHQRVVTRAGLKCVHPPGETALD